MNAKCWELFLRALENTRNIKLLVPNFLAFGAAFVLLLFYSAACGSVSVIFFYLLLSVTFLLFPFRKSRTEVSLYFLALNFVFSFSVILYLVYVWRYGAPYLGGGSDDKEYEYHALMVYELVGFYDRDAIENQIQFYGHNSLGYVYFLGLIIKLSEFVGGYDTMLPRLFNAAFLGYASVIVRRIVAKLTLSNDRGLAAGLWMIFFPIMFYSSAHIFRDTLTLLLLVATLYCALEISLSSKYLSRVHFLGCVLIVLLLSVLMTQLRFLYVIPMLVMLLSALLVVLMPVRYLRLWHLVPVSVACIVVYGAIKEIHFFSSAMSLMAFYSDSLAAGARGSDNGLSAHLFSLPQPVQSIARFSYALITPLPIVYMDAERNILSLGTVVQFLFVGFFFVGFFRIAKDYRNLPLIAGFVIVFSAYVFGTFTFRHITQWFPFALIIAFYGHFKYGKRVLDFVLVSFFILIIFYISYLFLVL